MVTSRNPKPAKTTKAGSSVKPPRKSPRKSAPAEEPRRFRDRETAEAEIRREFAAFVDSAQCKAWLRIADILGKAKHDPVVEACPAAREFAERMARAAGDSLEIQRVEYLERAVEVEWLALQPTQRGAAARSLIARKVGHSPQAVGPYVKAIRDRQKRK